MRRHSLDLIPLLFGVLFVVAGAGFLVHETTGRDFDGTWVSAFVFIGLGAIGLAVTLLQRDREIEP